MLLSGAGADELLGGHERYFDGRPAEHVYRSLPGAVRQIARGALAGVAGGRYRGHAAMNELPLAARYVGRSRLGLRLPSLGAELSAEFRRFEAAEPGARPMLVNLVTVLPESLLHTFDRMNAASGLRQRFPFLDHRLVRLAIGLPVAVKINPWRRRWKICLKEAMRNDLPAVILSRNKWTYAPPHPLEGVAASELTGELITPLVEVINARAFPGGRGLRPEDLTRYDLWSCLVYGVWMRVFVEGRGRRPASGAGPS